MNVGRTIFFDKETGEILVDTLEKKGFTSYREPIYYIERYKALSERNRETFDYIELEYGQYAQDFSECNGYRVNPETKELEFSYPDPNEEEQQEPVYQKPLSMELKETKQAVADTNALVLELLEVITMGGI